MSFKSHVMDEPKQANFECAAYLEMKDEIKLHYDLVNGTKAMRKNGYLKKFPVEGSDSFESRNEQAVLYNKYGKAVTANCGLILKREPQVVEGTNVGFFKSFSEHWENIDSAGTHGAVFTNQFFEEMFAGHAFIVVDAPSRTGDDLSDQKQSGWRPYWNIYRANQAINWRTATIQGKTVLSQIVFRKQITIPVGEFGEQQIFEYKAYRLTPMGVSWAVFRHKDNDETQGVYIFSSGMIAEMAELPIAIGYGKYKGVAQSSPPLKDLGYQNIRHFNKESDYDKADAYAGIVFMVAIGDAEIDSASHDLLVKCTDGGDFQLRETSGQALEAKRALLDRIENQMDILALSLLIDRAQGDVSATQSIIDNTQKTSELSQIAMSGKDAIERAIEIHGDFMNIPKTEVCSIDLGFNPNSFVLSPQTATLLLEACKNNKLSTVDFLSALKSSGEMHEEFDVEMAVKNLLDEMDTNQDEDVMTASA